MIVVADTSVVLNLCILGLDLLLSRLFGQVYAPPEVKAEFVRLAETDERFKGLGFPLSILLAEASSTEHRWAETPTLHRGEIAALSLAIELEADLVLMDEAQGRAVAASLQLSTMGLLGILLRARQSSIIPSIAPFLDRLEREARFWMAPSLRTAVLQAAAESPD